MKFDNGPVKIDFVFFCSIQQERKSFCFFQLKNQNLQSESIIVR